MSEFGEPARRSDHGGKPWGPWSTVGLGVLIVVLWGVLQHVAVSMLTGQRIKAADTMAQGWLVARMTLVGAPVVVGATVLLARLRSGISVAAYLGLAWPRPQHALRWSLVLLGLIALFDSLSLMLGRPVVPELMIAMYQTAGALPIFLIGIVVAAPLAEEFLFRGFLLPGLVNSRLGPSGAIISTAVAWGGLHAQYDVYGVVTIVVSGILLGWVRWRTGSLWLCALLHGLMNVVASVEVMLILSRR